MKENCPLLGDIYVIRYEIKKPIIIGTVSNKSLVKLKFGKIVYFAKLHSSKVVYILDKILNYLCRQIDSYVVSPNFSHTKLSLFTVYYGILF